MFQQEKKIILSGMNLEELEELALSLDEPKFRAAQLHSWLYKKSASEFDQMTNLSKDFRNKLKQISLISDTAIKQKLISSDGTIKYLLEFPDGTFVETVLMSFDKRPNLTACVSSQVGCPVGCTFCATGQRGFTRNLEPKEIIDQILTIQRDTGLEITNIVYMGQGEPLLNYDNVMNSIKFLNNNMDIGMRRITVSTSGIIPKIKDLANENRQLTLALSLHAPNHELRKQLIPVEKKYPITELIESLKFLTKKTGRRVTIEYILIDKLNDTPEMAEELIKLVKGLNCNINLIPYNAVNKDDFKTSSKKKIDLFKSILAKSGQKVTVRLERGSDILAACGQLSGKELTDTRMI
jgi:23S rRNA (adenine2503-C2)-methyltransferase